MRWGGILIVIFQVLTYTVNAQDQDDEEFKKMLKVVIKEEKKELEDGWNTGGVNNINFSQTSLTNWTSGGQDAITINGILNAFAILKKERFIWENTLNMSYGIINTENFKGFRKNDDQFILISKYGKKISKYLFFTALMNFRTQMAPGYDYKNDSAGIDYITNFLAPGYIVLPLGLDYKPSSDLSLFFSPITAKWTMVFDNGVEETSFGLDSGRTVRTEVGAFLNLQLKKKIMENVTFSTSAEFFTNYVTHFGNIDVNWTALLAMKVNKIITASISTQLIYDDDIAVKREDGSVGPATQFKEVLAIGLSFNF